MATLLALLKEAGLELASSSSNDDDDDAGMDGAGAGGSSRPGTAAIPGDPGPRSRRASSASRESVNYAEARAALVAALQTDDVWVEVPDDSFGTGACV